MNEVRSISLREIGRLRQRFSGAASPLAVLLLLGAIVFTAFTLRDAATPGNGLYRVGITADAPQIEDSRFAVTRVDAARGVQLLQAGAIDVLINGAQVVTRPDDRSQYAEHALKVYLKKVELERISQVYAYDQTFPLRVGIYSLAPRPAGSGGPKPGGTGAPAAAAAPPTQPQETIIPSLTPPPTPFVQVLLALIFVLPVTFISIFFTSSFMDEKNQPAPGHPAFHHGDSPADYCWQNAALPDFCHGSHRPDRRTDRGQCAAGAGHFYAHDTFYFCDLFNGAALLPHL